MISALLRAIAVAIAIAGVVDPVLSLERPLRPALSIVTVSQRSDSAKTAIATAVSSVVDQLSSLLGDDFELTVSRSWPASRAAACPAAGGCLLVSDGSLPGRLSDGADLLGAVRVGGDAPAAAIVDVRGSRDAHLSAAAVLEVDLEARNPGAESIVQVFDDGALVGRAAHKWMSAGTADAVRETVAVEWVPLGAGPRRLRIVVAASGDATRIDDEAETVVNVSALPVPIVFYEPETTWMGTFVRRALEADPRFQLAGRAQVTPTVSVTRGTGDRLRHEALRVAQVVIVSAAERLSAGDVELLDRFARIRGGSVVLLPDAEMTGPVARLVPPVDRSAQEADPRAIGALRAREILSFRLSAGVTALASTGDRPVVVARPTSRGRIVVSGALDAWRYRDDGAFNRFWTSLIVDTASAAGPTVSARLDRSLLEPGETANVRIDWRSLDEMPATVTAAAIVDCAGDRQPVRLWPEGRRGAFGGIVEALRPGACTITANVGATTRPATTSFITATNVRRATADSAAFERAIAARGGSVVGPGELESLATRARAARQTARQREGTQPMHSPWWVVPFAACLGGEWLFRRRAGLR